MLLESVGSYERANNFGWASPMDLAEFMLLGVTPIEASLACHQSLIDARVASQQCMSQFLVSLSLEDGSLGHIAPAQVLLKVSWPCSAQ